jgi:hypothetical protein
MFLEEYNKFAAAYVLCILITGRESLLTQLTNFLKETWNILRNEGE